MRRPAEGRIDETTSCSGVANHDSVGHPCLACGIVKGIAMLNALVIASILALPPALAASEERTLVVALRIDRDEARLLAYTLKERAFARRAGPALPESRGREPEERFEVTLHGSAGVAYTTFLDARFLCLAHGPASPPHVQGDMIVTHRDTFLVELPEMRGADRIEIAHLSPGQGPMHRRTIGSERLDGPRFLRAGGQAAYEDLLIADPEDTGPEAFLTSGTVVWPEQLSDYNIHTVYGDPGDAARRINITIIPDGYTYAEKGMMKSDADDLVAYLRARSPYAEHETLFNFTLIYAYSLESGTDQCDCSIVRDTAMGTTFLPGGDSCGGDANRCLYYAGGCDVGTEINLVAAELRAPAHDRSFVMVNTGRYGGCAGQRAVYSAGHGLALQVAHHEMGHALAGLADEYTSDPGCGSFAGEINTSLNGAEGAWPEWIPDLGAPREGAQYFEQCIYRPYDNCVMRASPLAFCPVCRQHLALTIFSHARIEPTAPVASAYPPPQSSACADVPQSFDLDTRLPSGQGATSSILWTLAGPGLPQPTVVATGVDAISRTFDQPGSFSLTAEVIAGTNAIKPQKHGQNRDIISWGIEVGDAAGDLDGDLCGVAVDCDNSNAAVRPGGGQVCDGVNNDCNHPAWPSVAGTSDGDDDGDSLSECQGDCDDARATVMPGGQQLCGDGRNNDCSDASWPAVPEDDHDGDGDGLSECQGDCDDLRATVRPFGAPICDGLNNDCGDPSWPAVPAGDHDGDGDALSECQGDCDDLHAAVYPGASPICDGLNNNCLLPGWPSLAGSNEADDDGDGLSECAGDCGDFDDSTYPGATEVNDGADNQCEGDTGFELVDEISGECGFADGDNTGLLCWTPQTGAVSYTVLRSDTPLFDLACADFTVSGSSCLTDSSAPPPDAVWFYLVRAETPNQGSWGANSSEIERSVSCLPECGNGVREGPEVCDGPDLGGQTCQSVGFDGGNLACNATCTNFIFSGCLV